MKIGMKIDSIKINGFKKLVQFSIDPDGKSISISGRNKEGKSSIIEAVWVALTGQDVPGVPVNKGSIKAKIVVGLDSGHTVRLEFGPKGKTLIVEGPDGEPVKAPASFLKSLIGEISFDPFAFSEMTPAEQKKFLQDLLKLDFSDLDTRKTAELAEKRDAETDAKSIERQLDALAGSLEVLPVDVSVLMAENDARLIATGKINSLNVEIEKIETALASDEGDLARMGAEIRAAEARIVELCAQVTAKAVEREAKAERIAKGRAIVGTMQAEADKMPDHSQAIRNASETNAKAEEWKRKVALRAEYDICQKSVETAKQKLEDIENDRKERLFSAKFPVEGLTFTESGVLFNGLPFNERNQCKSDIIRVGVAIAIAQSPNLKIASIKDGSLLDASSRQEILQILNENGFQTFIETVEDHELRALTIEEISVTPSPVDDGQTALTL